MRNVCALVALALLASGCATYSWYKADVPPEIAAQDSQECRSQASYMVNRWYMDEPFWWGTGWRHLHPYPTWPTSSALGAEQDVFNRCMYYKGYALIKDPKPPRASGGS
jgi:hypothetical protein